MVLRSGILILVSSVVLLSCQSANKPVGASGGPGSGSKAVVPTAPPLETSPMVKGINAIMAHALTAVGDNRAPRFSPDGSKILFLSAARPSHRHWQVYELDMTRMTERRVTFHDGDDEGAAWAAGGQKIVYSSVTDEMKEDVSMARLKAVYEASKATGTAPNGIRVLPKKAGGDVYSQRLDGREIERLTSTSGFDGSPTADPSSRSTRLVFVSERDTNSRLYLTDGRTAKPISGGGDTSPAFSPDGKALVWERTLTPPGGTAQTQLMVTSNLKTAVPLTSPGFIDRSPAFGPKSESVIFSSNRGGKVFDLYVIDRNGSCLKRLTQSKIDLNFPSLSPDGTKIAFSARAGSQNQIYTMDNHAPTLPCLALPTPVATPAATPALTPTPSPTAIPAAASATPGSRTATPITPTATPATLASPAPAKR